MADSLADPFNAHLPPPVPTVSPSSSSPSSLTPTPRLANHRPTLTTLLNTSDLSHATQSSTDLPQAPPLSHDSLSQPDFDPSDFLLQRRHTSLDELRSELRAYLATLRSSLVGVINEEYEAFIGLSLGLKQANVSQSLATIRRPVLSIRNEVSHVKGELEEMRDEMSDVLDERKAVREQKAVMRRLLATEEAVEKVEGLLQVGKGGEKARQLDLNVDSPAKRLERIASEYTHMRYLVERAGDLPFVHSLEPRISHLTSTLHSALSALLASNLSTPPSSPTYRSELVIALRTFSSLSLLPLAETIARETVLDPFVRTSVNRDSLISSPPFQDNSTPAYVPSSYRISPISPPAAHRDGGADSSALCALYNRLLRFVEEDCSVLLDVAERELASSLPPSDSRGKKDTSTSSATSSSASDKPGGYELLTNVVVDSLLTALVTSLGASIFAAGRPTVFHQNYLLTQSFISRLEHLCPTLTHLHSLRHSPAYLGLFKRFQLPVYFQLRLKDAVTTVERAFDVGQASGGGGKESGFVMSESEAVYKALGTCWEDEVWLEELGGRFWKLTLQILSRYRTWLNDHVPKYVLPSSASSANLSAAAAGQASSRGSFDGDRSRLSAAPSASSTRPTSPAPPGGDDQSEEATLRQLTVLIADARTMERKVGELFEERIREKVKGDEQAGDVIASSLTALTSLIPSLSSQLTTILIKRCAEHLKLVRSVASQVRASTRRGASEPSYFVHNILKELRAYLTGPGRVVEEELRMKWATVVVEELAGRYAAILSTQKKTEDSLRWLKKGRQGLSFFSRGSSSTPAAEGESDDDRVKMQMQLDVETLAKDAQELGVDVDGSEAFAGLRRATTAEVKEEGVEVKK